MPPSPRLIEDPLGRQISVPFRPARIVSLVPSVTELLFALGAGPRVAGVSRYCCEPAGAVEELPRVGGQKDTDLEAIVALEPDLVIAVKEDNRARDVETLEDRGLAVYVADVTSVEAGVGLIAELGDLVDGDPARTERLGRRARAGVRRAMEIAAAAPRPPLRVFCPVWRDPWITVSPTTYMFDVLRTCGAEPIPAGRRDMRYPKVTLDEVRAARPEAILLPDEPYPFGDEDRRQLQALAPTRIVDGKLLGWHGPRASQMHDIATLLSGAAILSDGGHDGKRGSATVLR